MPSAQRVKQYIQRLAYETFCPEEARDDRPGDVLKRVPAPTPIYAAWSATSYAGYVPFRSPASH